MNIFSIYFEKIKKFLIDLEKDKQIKLSDNFNKLTIFGNLYSSKLRYMN